MIKEICPHEKQNKQTKKPNIQTKKPYFGNFFCGNIFYNMNLKFGERICFCCKYIDYVIMSMTCLVMDIPYICKYLGYTLIVDK